MKYAVSIDDETPQVMVLNKEDNQPGGWAEGVADNIIIKTSVQKLLTSGRHVLKYSAVSPAVVLQKLVVGLESVKESYLGPPETRLR